MNVAQFVLAQLKTAEFVVQAYLGDLTDAEMLVRPCADANHAAWQLGHAIESERYLMENAFPGSMPELPAGFAKQHGSEAAKSDRPQDFLRKDEYLKLAGQVRAATVEAVLAMNPDDLDRPAPEGLPPFVRVIGDLVAAVAPHWLGHAGQWVVLRRKLGRPRQF